MSQNHNKTAMCNICRRVIREDDLKRHTRSKHEDIDTNIVLINKQQRQFKEEATNHGHGAEGCKTDKPIVLFENCENMNSRLNSYSIMRCTKNWSEWLEFSCIINCFRDSVIKQIVLGIYKNEIIILYCTMKMINFDSLWPWEYGRKYPAHTKMFSLDLRQIRENTFPFYLQRRLWAYVI